LLLVRIEELILHHPFDFLISHPMASIVQPGDLVAVTGSQVAWKGPDNMIRVEDMTVLPTVRRGFLSASMLMG
jgi:hypothetical protein